MPAQRAQDSLPCSPQSAAPTLGNSISSATAAADGNGSYSVSHLQAENLRLRQELFRYNEEVYALKESMAVIEVEKKMELQQELKKQESTLTFQTQELTTLQKKFQATSKELAMLKANVRAGTIATGPTLSSSASSSSASAAESGPVPVPVPLLLRPSAKFPEFIVPPPPSAPSDDQVKAADRTLSQSKAPSNNIETGRDMGSEVSSGRFDDAILPTVEPPVDIGQGEDKARLSKREYAAHGNESIRETSTAINLLMPKYQQLVGDICVLEKALLALSGSDGTGGLEFGVRGPTGGSPFGNRASPFHLGQTRPSPIGTCIGGAPTLTGLMSLPRGTPSSTGTR